MINADEFVRVGSAMVGLGRWMQRTFIPANVIGSQCAEDSVLAQLLPGSGTYVDVGASHPIECSNTWALYQRGWRGLLIEPLPERWHNLLRTRPGDMLCPSAASDEDSYGYLRLCRDLSSFRPDWSIEEQGMIYCERERLATILARYPTIRDTCQFCSIDVEGHESAVLSGIDWATFHPTVLCIEYRKYEPTTRGRSEAGHWSHIVQGAGYKLHTETDLNRIYVRHDEVPSA